jgi:hypothetical protein
MLGLFIGLFYAVILGIAVPCMRSRISPWIWAVPLSCLYVAGTMLIVTRGDRIIAAEQKKEDALPNDA